MPLKVYQFLVSEAENMPCITSDLSSPYDIRFQTVKERSGFNFPSSCKSGKVVVVSVIQGSAHTFS